MEELAKSPGQIVLSKTVVKRRLPVNLNPLDNALFIHEMEREIPETRLLEISDVRVSDEGILFRGGNMLAESFAFPANLKQWKQRSLLKFFVSNHVLRRSSRVEHDVLWITDDWSDGYFHWLTDALTRLYLMRDRLDDWVLLLPASYQSLDYVLASLKAFGVMEVEFTRTGEVLKCRRLFMPTHTAPSGHYNEDVIQGVREQLLKAFGEVRGIGASERLYISRSRARKRRIVNEEAVIEVMSEFGFETLYPEDLTFEQQVRICSRARYLVSNHGAGLTNMMFVPQGASVLELRHHTDKINNCYFTLASALRLNYLYQTCQSDNSIEDPHAANLLVDTNTLKANLSLLLST